MRVGTLAGSASGTHHLADRLGIWASALCVVHCLLTPVLLSFSAVMAHLLPGEESTHRLLSVLVALFGAAALVRGFRVHQHRRVVVMMAGGLGCIAGTAWFGDRLPTHVWEVSITLLGSLLMITAHRLNHTFCQQCDCAAPCKPKAGQIRLS